MKTGRMPLMKSLMMVHKREQQFIVFVRKQGSRLVFKGANVKHSFIIRKLHISLNLFYLLKCAKETC